MILDYRDVESCLLHKLGFTPAKGHKKGHKWYELKLVDGRRILTRLSHGDDDIRDPLQNKMAKQLHVCHETFVGAVSCAVSKEQYVDEAKNWSWSPR